MQLALRTVRGMGAAVSSFTDTGAGITPAAFASMCCDNGTFAAGNSVSGPSDCDYFLNANASLFGFGAASPCSADAIANLTMPGPVASVAAVPAPGLTPSGQPVNPCTGALVVTSQDAADLQACLVTQQTAAQVAAVKAQMTANASAQCVAQKALCAQNWLQTQPTVDCTGCQMPTGGSSLMVAAGVAAVVALLFFMKR